MLRQNKLGELTELLNELKPATAERRKLSIISREQVEIWNADEKLIAQLTENNEIAEIQVPMTFPTITPVKRHWNQLRDQWKWSDAGTSNEEVLWNRVALLMDMWKWYGEAIHLTEGEMLQYWKKWSKWQDELHTPQRWLPGWTLEMIKEECDEYRDAEDEMSFELWLWRNKQWTMHRLAVPRDATAVMCQEKIVDYVASLRYNRCRVRQLRVDTWYPVILEDLKSYPCAVIWPEYDNSLKEEASETWEEMHWLREDTMDETDRKFLRHWQAFEKAKKEAEDRIKKEDWLKKAQIQKLRILEYKQIRIEIETRLQELVRGWSEHYKAKEMTEGQTMIQELEVKLSYLT
jgi:hypothetical protein